MPNDDTSVLAVYRKAIEGRLAEQMARHANASSGTDPKRVALERLGVRPKRRVLAVCSLSRLGNLCARATEQRLAGRRAASGARLKPDVSLHK